MEFQVQQFQVEDRRPQRLVLSIWNVKLSNLELCEAPRDLHSAL